MAALASCAPIRQLDEVKAKLTSCETELSAIKKASQENEASLAALKEAAVANEKPILHDFLVALCLVL